MKYNVLSEQELAYHNLIKAGCYNFDVVEAEEKVSRQGSPMIKIVLRITRDNNVFHINDYLPSEAVWKIKQFLEAVGESSWYQQGELTTEDCLCKQGRLIVNIVDTEYGQKTRVTRYLPLENS